MERPPGDRAAPTAVATVTARAALAGNPSDGFGGAVVAAPVPCFAATATVRVRDETTGPSVPRPDGDLARLVDATLDELVDIGVLDARRRAGLDLEVVTTIPRSVGLAGSSAIVLAVIDAIRASASGAPSAALARLADPSVRAAVALVVERDRLGITAGLQDRLVQAHAAPVLMEFGPETPPIPGVEPPIRARTTRLAGPPGAWVLAHRVASAASSDAVHAPLAARSDELGPAMNELAGAARSAAGAIRGRSLTDLAAAIDRSFELRASILDLDPRHVEMVEVARRHGGHANYTGSGGAVIVLAPGETRASRIADALRALDDCEVTPRPLDATL